MPTQTIKISIPESSTIPDYLNITLEVHLRMEKKRAHFSIFSSLTHSREFSQNIFSGIDVNERESKKERAFSLLRRTSGVMFK